MSNFANNFRIIRNNKGVSQEEIATAINRTREAVSKWEKGISEPNAEDLMNIADFLNVPIDLLIRKSKVQDDLIFSEKVINELKEELNKIQKKLNSLNEILSNPKNKNIIVYEDTGKQRVPKKQFRNGTYKEDKSIKIENNNGGNININNSFNDNE